MELTDICDVMIFVSILFSHIIQLGSNSKSSECKFFLGKLTWNVKIDLTSGARVSYLEKRAYHDVNSLEDIFQWPRKPIV